MFNSTYNICCTQNKVIPMHSLTLSRTHTHSPRGTLTPSLLSRGADTTDYWVLTDYKNCRQRAPCVPSSLYNAHELYSIQPMRTTAVGVPLRRLLTQLRVVTYCLVKSNDYTNIRSELQVASIIFCVFKSNYLKICITKKIMSKVKQRRAYPSNL